MYVLWLLLHAFFSHFKENEKIRRLHIVVTYQNYLMREGKLITVEPRLDNKLDLSTIPTKFIIYDDANK